MWKYWIAKAVYNMGGRKYVGKALDKIGKRQEFLPILDKAFEKKAK